MNLIEPKILRGTRDFGPVQMRKRQYVISQLRSIFEDFLYEPIETPAIEYAKTILGKYGDEGDQLTYTFKDQGRRHIALRYDQTVPTARFVAANQNTLAFPFKRYQIGPVWRADKPQKGRYREFYQCDIDIIGTKSLRADAEMAQVMHQAFTKLGVDPFVIRVNSRKLINDILDACKVKKYSRIEVIRLMDKLDKVSLRKVQKELEETSMTREQVNQLSELALSEQSRNRLDHLPDGEGKAEMGQLFTMLQQMGIPQENIMLDLTLARGLDYYTGVIYEAIIPDSDYGSICGGGRYDDLTEIFTDKKFPGTGVAFGLDRIVDWLDEHGKLDEVAQTHGVLIANFPDTLQQAEELAENLREEGIAAELYLEPAKLQKQFKYADKKGLQWMILLGSDEVKQKKLMLRNLVTGEQELLTFKQAVKRLRQPQT